MTLNSAQYNIQKWFGNRVEGVIRSRLVQTVLNMTLNFYPILGESTPLKQKCFSPVSIHTLHGLFCTLFSAEERPPRHPVFSLFLQDLSADPLLSTIQPTQCVVERKRCVTLLQDFNSIQSDSFYLFTGC